MAISIAVNSGCCCCYLKSAKKVAPYLDLIVGVALLAIGLLSMYGVIGINAISSIGTGFFMGAGSMYFALALFRVLAKQISWRPCC